MNVEIRKIEQVIWKSHDDLLYLPSAYQEMNKQNLLTKACLTKACLTKDESQVTLNNIRILHLTQNVISSRQSLKVMYQSNRSFNMPPRAIPRAFDFFENYCSNSPLPGPKCRSNAPHWGPFRWSNAPTPGTFHRHKNDRRTAETPSVVEQNL